MEEEKDFITNYILPVPEGFQYPYETLRGDQKANIVTWIQEMEKGTKELGQLRSYEDDTCRCCLGHAEVALFIRGYFQGLTSAADALPKLPMHVLLGLPTYFDNRLTEDNYYLLWPVTLDGKPYLAYLNATALNDGEGLGYIDNIPTYGIPHQRIIEVLKRFYLGDFTVEPAVLELNPTWDFNEEGGSPCHLFPKPPEAHEQHNG